MRFSYVILISLILFLVFQSCKKEEASPSTPPPTGFQTPAVEDIVMYEINFSAFSASKNIQGVIDRLDSIKALGINTIWLMPIYPVGVLNSFGSPYCVKDYLAVNSSLGTMQDLQTLVSKAHEKNMAVILDWVANHTSWDNSWISNKSWYTQDANGNIISPPGTNWNDVADLNYNNDTMRLAMIAAMKYWIDTAGIDGYRCDAADYVPYYFWVQAIDSLHKIPGKNLILLAEGSRADHFTAGFQMNYAWDFLSTLKNVFPGNQSATSLYTTNNTEYASVPVGDRKLRFTTNHDESNTATPISVFGGKDGALAASVIAIYLQGVPLIYCGQEVGVSSTAVYNGAGPINWSLNTDMLTAYKQLLGFYNSSVPARKGTLATFAGDDVATFLKTYNGSNVLVMVNTRPVDKAIAVPTSLQGSWTNALTGSSIIVTDSLSFAPYQYLVLKN